MLRHVNALSRGNFDPESFEISSTWNPSESYMQFALVSQRAHEVEVAGQTFRFEQDEPIHVGLSYKDTPERLMRIASAAGWTLAKFWHDPEKLVGLYLLVGMDVA